MSTPAEGQPAPGVAPEDAPASPAQTPVTPTTPEPKPAPVKIDPAPNQPEAPTSEPGDNGEVIYEPTGDVRLDVALEFIGRLGIGSDHQAMQAAIKGDLSLLKATLATMGDKARGWEQMVALAEQANVDAAKAADELAAKVQQAVHSVAGGEAQWSTALAWAAKNATPEEKTALNAMFDAGPVQARAAAMAIMDAYGKAGGTVVNPANPTKNLSGTSPAATNSALSPRDYAAAVRDLRAKLGNRMDASPEYATLRARHAAYRG